MSEPDQLPGVPADADTASEGAVDDHTADQERRAGTPDAADSPATRTTPDPLADH